MLYKYTHYTRWYIPYLEWKYIQRYIVIWKIDNGIFFNFSIIAFAFRRSHSHSSCWMLQCSIFVLAHSINLLFYCYLNDSIWLLCLWIYRVSFLFFCFRCFRKPIYVSTLLASRAVLHKAPCVCFDQSINQSKHITKNYL